MSERVAVVWHLVTYRVLVDTALQVREPMKRDPMFVCADELFVGKVAKHFIDAFAGGTDH